MGQRSPHLLGSKVRVFHISFMSAGVRSTRPYPARPARHELCVVVNEPLNPLKHPRNRRRSLDDVRVRAILNMQRVAREQRVHILWWFHRVKLLVFLELWSLSPNNLPIKRKEDADRSFLWHNSHVFYG